MISNIHFPCSYKNCKNMIGQKANKWCVKKGLPPLCFEHQSQNRLENLYKKSASQTTSQSSPVV